MDECDYPALFRSADQTSDQKQALHLTLIKTEYGLLLLAAIFSMNQFSGTVFYAVYACVFVLLIGVLLTRAYLRPVQQWYKSRALAESVKTLTWRYMMKAPPFDGAESHDTPRAELAKQLRALLKMNESIAGQIIPNWSDASQITVRMDEVRALEWTRRRDFYQQHRVQDQRRWYTREAKNNRRDAIRWVVFGVLAYVIAGVLTLSRIWLSDWNFWPIEPIIVFASSIIGWMQLKKFGELAAAYNVTAQDIGLLEANLADLNGDTKVAEFVNEAELAFSREHTMWIARQTN